MSDLQQRYLTVKQTIADACIRLGRDLDEITLIVVSKNHPASLVEELFSLDHRDFGENRDQEAGPKASELSALSGLTWHFIGQLQSNKVKRVLDYAAVIHSLDRPSLVDALAKELARRNKTVSGFIQLNLTDDPNRGGIQLPDLLPFAEVLANMGMVEIQGVMAVAALDRDPRLDFELISEASQLLRREYPAAKFISAGMSHDFEAALEFGATHLRIGTAITGNRNL